MAKAVKSKRSSSKNKVKKAISKANPRIGTSVNIIPGLRLYVSYGKSGVHFNLGGSPKRIVKGVKKALVDRQSKRIVDAEAEQLEAMFDEEDQNVTDLAKRNS